jgi:peptidoglycan/LPS O-acetylase OafA/YrhL
MDRQNKDASLEALRGIAAVIVVFWHCTLGFFPASTGYFTNFSPDDALVGEPWFGVLNGDAAVAFFFVLSGFVLTRRYFENKDDLSIARGVVKRWPRLAVPAFAAVMVSWALFHFDLYRHADVAQITKSPWLYYFSFASKAPFATDFWTAIAQGGFFTFFRGEALLDPPLWTMRYELIGSYVAFALAFILLRLPGRDNWLAIFLIIVVMLLCHYAHTNYVPFPVGVALAYFLVRRPFVLPFWAAGILLVVAGYLAGYTGHAVGAYQLFDGVFVANVPYVYVHIVASVIAISAVEAWAGIRRILQNRFFLFLGEISFPLYLIHVPVLCSAGCWVFLAAAQSYDPQSASWIAAAVTVVCSFVAAVPLLLLNRGWLAMLSRFMSRVIPAASTTPLPGTSARG